MRKEFERLCKQLGFSCVPVATMINGHWIKRPDILSVRYAGFHIMTIPAVIYDHPTERYVSLEGKQHPMFYELEHQLRSWERHIKRGNFIDHKEKQEREIVKLYKNLCQK